MQSHWVNGVPLYRRSPMHSAALAGTTPVSVRNISQPLLFR
jgi:hypothetical protein